MGKNRQREIHPEQFRGYRPGRCAARMSSTILDLTPHHNNEYGPPMNEEHPFPEAVEALGLSIGGN